MLQHSELFIELGVSAAGGYIDRLGNYKPRPCERLRHVDAVPGLQTPEPAALYREGHQWISGLFRQNDRAFFRDISRPAGPVEGKGRRQSRTHRPDHLDQRASSAAA